MHWKAIAAHESRLFPCRKPIQQGQNHLGNASIDTQYYDLLQEEDEHIFNEDPDTDEMLRQQPFEKDNAEMENLGLHDDGEEQEVPMQSPPTQSNDTRGSMQSSIINKEHMTPG